MSKPEPRDGLHLNHIAGNYNFIEGGKWAEWADSPDVDTIWKAEQGRKSHRSAGWYAKAELKVPLEYLT